MWEGLQSFQYRMSSQHWAESNYNLRCAHMITFLFMQVYTKIERYNGISECLPSQDTFS
jgi:hypothetical protein